MRKKQRDEIEVRLVGLEGIVVVRMREALVVHRRVGEWATAFLQGLSVQIRAGNVPTEKQLMKLGEIWCESQGRSFDPALWMNIF